MDEIKELSEVVTQKVERHLPFLEALTSAMIGSPMNLRLLSPKNIASHTIDYLRHLKEGAFYLGYKTAYAVVPLLPKF